MTNRNVLLIFNILILSIVVVISGCGAFMGILDTNPYNDEPPDNKVYHEQRVEEIRQEFLGLSKEDVLDRLGKPKWVNHLGENYQSPIRFRENQYVFDGKKKCRMSECGAIFEDESWAYSWEIKTKKYYTQHGFAVFFKDGLVVAVE